MNELADFLQALITVYTLIIFASIIVSWLFSFGVRVPYSLPLNAVFDFLRDVSWRLAAAGAEPGSLSAADLLRELGA